MATVAYCAVAREGRAGLRRLTNAVHAEGSRRPRRSATPARSPTRFPAELRPSAPAERSHHWVSGGPRRPPTTSSSGSSRPTRTPPSSRSNPVDAVEIHCGHDHLVRAFVSPSLNKRDDRYGGSLANRAWLALAVTRAVRDAVGDRAAITMYAFTGDAASGSSRRPSHRHCDGAFAWADEPSCATTPTRRPTCCLATGCSAEGFAFVVMARALLPRARPPPAA